KSPNDESRQALFKAIRAWSFVIPSSFGFGHSSLGFRAFPGGPHHQGAVLAPEGDAVAHGDLDVRRRPRQVGDVIEVALRVGGVLVDRRVELTAKQAQD